MFTKKAMLIDVSKCIACRACQVACKQWNQLPTEKTHFTGTYQNPLHLSATTWTIISFIEPNEGKTRWLFRKQQCLHCTEATCVKVCPTGAAKVSEDGIVFIDQNICTGCKYCVESCPFNVPQFDRKSGTVKKCKMCLDRVINGLKPACAKACITGAISFDERTKILAIAKERQDALNKKKLCRLYGEKELGGLGVMYLLPEPAIFYGLPEQPRLPIDKVFLKWLAGIIPGVAILYGIWRYFKKEDK